MRRASVTSLARSCVATMLARCWALSSIGIVPRAGRMARLILQSCPTDEDNSPLAHCPSPRRSDMRRGCRDSRTRDSSIRATWRSGDATVCKTVNPGSIPGVASTFQINGLAPIAPVGIQGQKQGWERSGNAHGGFMNVTGMPPAEPGARPTMTVREPPYAACV